MSRVPFSCPADERVCDDVAQWFSAKLIGAPDAHPFYKDADARLDALRQFVDRHVLRLRRLPYRWGRAADVSPFDNAFYPDVLFADRPATPDDVTAGRAVFALPAPGGKPDDRGLPMTGKLTPPGGGAAQLVLILQSERDADGKLHYGVLGRHVLREAMEAEVTDVKPMVKEREE